ncbi:MAG: DUF3685 domain-containing protein [Gloeocapsa sp. DLM2.Bin57]|nr:MAG: DUF3685 domain-containing protein [Gloeocapsa sp. DLM2.Bin57]
MTNSQRLQILLVDDDPIFAIGLQTALREQGYTDILISNQVTTAESALSLIANNLPDLVVLELNLRLADPAQISGIQFCQEVHRQYPNLPIFLLTSQTNPELLLTAYNLGVKGYCVKGTPLTTVVRGLREVASGGNYWQSAQNIQTITPKRKSQKWLQVQRRVGLEQIDNSLKKVNHSLSNSNLPVLDWLFWRGRRRELLLARWLVNQLLPVEYVVIDNQVVSASNIVSDSTSAIVPNPQASLIPSQQTQINKNNIYEKTLAQIQSGVDNLTKSPLEIDILRTKPKKELLYLVYNQVIRTVDKLKFTNTDEEELLNNINLIIKDLWQVSSFDFITKHYANILTEKVQLLDILLKEAEFIREDLLDKIPFKLEVFQYLISEEIEPEKVQARLDILWHNLIIEIANGVMLTILNNFLDEEIIQPDIYQHKIISSRDIAKFRNRLSWKYRREKYLEDPQNIFEDQYKVYYFDKGGILKTYIKACRKNELKQLKGFRWWVTIAVEARDAIAPGIVALIDWLGRIVVYLLTEVIGKAIGLIGKGFVQGIGNAVQETRYRNRNSNRLK